MPDVHEQENKMIHKAAMWGCVAAHEIREAGGHPEAVLGLFPKNLIATLVRNNITLKTRGIL